MADEKLDRTDVVLSLLGEGQRGADEAGHALPQRVVEPFDMIGFSRFFRNGFVALRRNDAVVHVILIRMKMASRALSV